MISAVDTNILIDIFQPDPVHGPRSRDLLQTCRAEGRLIACDIVWAEVAGMAPSLAQLAQALSLLQIDFSPVDAKAAFSAGEAWRLYRKRGGTRTRVLADFLVGAHAQTHADRLLTRDRGFYRAYFPKLTLMDPSV